MEGQNQPKIVIIGAGMAGIAAAQRLISRGFSFVTLLEAEDRVGGRMYTQKYGSGWIDIGAQWIHGQVRNPMYELALKHDLIDVVAQEASNYKDLEYYMSNGQFIPDSVIFETSTVLDNIFNEMTRSSREGELKEGETVGKYLQDQFYKQLTSDTADEVRTMKEGLFNWRLMMEKTENACSSIFDMSLSAWGDYTLCDGNDEVELAHGYKPILDIFLADIPSSCIKLNTRVQHVMWNASYLNSDAARCNILTSDGRTFEADHVIVTSSLGFLKANARSMFMPSLPDYKLAAIDCLGFGTVNKIYLEFDEPFWRSQCRAIEFVWRPDDSIKLRCLEKLNDECAELMEKAGEWYKAIHGFDVVAQHPGKLLCGWIAGKEAELMEILPDWLVLSICHELLQIFTGRPDMPKPSRIVRSTWKSGGLSLGSYSYRHTGSTARDSRNLAQPLCVDASSDGSTLTPVLMFAGEATHGTFFSTTHGALLSGQREAERISSHYAVNPAIRSPAVEEPSSELKYAVNEKCSKNLEATLKCNCIEPDEDLNNLIENIASIDCIGKCTNCNIQILM